MCYTLMSLPTPAGDAKARVKSLLGEAARQQLSGADLMRAALKTMSNSTDTHANLSADAKLLVRCTKSGSG